MADEYIKRSDAIRIASTHGADNFAMSPLLSFGTAKIVNDLQKLPKEDVQEVRHGEWRTKSKTRMGSHGESYFVYGCSLCKKQIKYKTDFCPNCGADMRGET